jgi:DNA-binding transcriptional MerR regulator
MKPNVLAAVPAVGSDIVRNVAETTALAVAVEDFLTISQMADKFGVTPRALRFYESKGLVKPGREGRGRVYSPADQHHVSLILKGRKLGFTIAEIGQMIAAEDGHVSAHALKLTREKCQEQIVTLERQLKETTEALAELRRMHANLAGG